MLIYNAKNTLTLEPGNGDKVLDHLAVVAERPFCGLERRIGNVAWHSPKRRVKMSDAAVYVRDVAMKVEIGRPAGEQTSFDGNAPHLRVGHFTVRKHAKSDKYLGVLLCNLYSWSFRISKPCALNHFVHKAEGAVVDCPNEKVSRWLRTEIQSTSDLSSEGRQRSYRVVLCQKTPRAGQKQWFFERRFQAATGVTCWPPPVPNGEGRPTALLVILVFRHAEEDGRRHSDSAASFAVIVVVVDVIVVSVPALDFLNEKKKEGELWRI
ncbi:hypothetical protein B0H14DRAFT_2557685 [Mycena olivaceomarginata]|nr:hypothetical protein B0H14DRAFT_2557685 [Mycena olivaceomarginata]